VARYRDARLTFFNAGDALPPGGINYIYSDHAGRLWLASSRGGLIRVDDPAAERPAFVSYTTAQGLSSNSTEVITDDLYGNIYVAPHSVLSLAPHRRMRHDGARAVRWPIRDHEADH